MDREPKHWPNRVFVSKDISPELRDKIETHIQQRGKRIVQNFDSDVGVNILLLTVRWTFVF